MFMPTARKPAQRFCVFLRCDIFLRGVGWGGGNNVLSLRYGRSLRKTPFMLRCTLLLYFGKHASCYVVHFCCTSVDALHATLYTSVVLP